MKAVSIHKAGMALKLVLVMAYNVKKEAKIDVLQHKN